MSKADVIEIEGTVVEKLPNAAFKGRCSGTGRAVTEVSACSSRNGG